MSKKSTLLLLLITGIFSSVTGQTLTGGVFPVAGDVFVMTLADTAGFNSGATGTGVTWNYSSLTPSGATTTDSFMSPSATPFASLVPNATIADRTITPAASQYVYYADNTSAGAFQRVANIQPDTVIYSTPASEYQYPLSYGSMESGSYYAKYDASGESTVEAGTVTGSVDGSGTLINPYGTYTNVIRSQATRNENDTLENGAATGITTVHYFDWYQPNSYFPIMEYVTTSITILGHPVYASVTVGYRPGYTSTTAVNDVAGDNTGWMVYPNPASQKATVVFQASGTGVTNITLYDLSGRVVQQLSAENTAGALQTTQLNIENIPAGIYLLTIKNNEGMATRKLEIAR